MSHWSKRLDDRRRQLGWTQRELAKRSGLDEALIRKYHQGLVDKPRGDIMATLARVVGVSQIWLEHGRVPQRMVFPLLGYIHAADAFLPETPRTDDFEVRPDELDLVCISLRADVGLPGYKHGDMVLCSKAAGRSENQFLNKDCAVCLTDGRVVLKRVTKGAKAGSYNLLGFNADPIDNVRPQWVAPVVMLIRDSLIINSVS